MSIIGNKKTINLLDRIAKSGKIAGAYLFLGPESVGKFSAAMEFAQNIIADGGKINSDLIVVVPEVEETKGIIRKKDIKIEAIRDLQHQLSLTSTGGKYKVAIIDEADRLNKASQNALLKTLEDPNSQVVLILISQNENKILPTVASRCQKARFGLVENFEIGKLIPIGNSNKQDILFWSVGRPGIALDLINDPTKLTNRKAALSELANMTSKNVSERFALAEEWSKDMPKMQKRLKFWLIALRQSILGNSAMLRFSPDRALELTEEISENMEQIRETNSNAKLILENLFLKF